MADAQISDKVAVAPEPTVDHGKEPESSQQEVAVAPVSSKKQSLSDIFTIVKLPLPPRHLQDRVQGGHLAN